MKKEDDINMNEKLIKASYVAKELDLYLKVVTSTSLFEDYNSFFNIFSENEEYCRRIVVLTPFEDLEEVSEKDLNLSITEPITIDGNIWIKEFPLTTNPNKINLEEIEISEEFYNKIINEKI